MSDLPIHVSRRSNRQVVRAIRARERTEMAIFEHQLEAQLQAEVDRIDSRALADVTKGALEGQFDVLDWGLAEAAGSPAKAELVARMVSQQSRIDSERIARRFGRRS